MADYQRLTAPDEKVAMLRRVLATYVGMLVISYVAIRLFARRRELKDAPVFHLDHCNHVGRDPRSSLRQAI